MPPVQCKNADKYEAKARKYGARHRRLASATLETYTND